MIHEDATLMEDDGHLINVWKALKIENIAYVVKARCSMKRRRMQTLFTMGDVREKAKTKLETSILIEMKYYIVEIILVESLPDKVLLYME